MGSGPLTTLAVLAAAAALAAPAAVPTPKVDRFDEDGAWGWLVKQVDIGPRPAGSPASRRLAAQLRSALPRGAYHDTPDGYRNVVGFVRGRDPSRLVVVGAHYDTKDLPGFVGANDGASGTAIVVQLARTIKPRQLRPSVAFILFDGEEATVDTGNFLDDGVHGSRWAAQEYKSAESMILLDMVGDRNLSIPREKLSNAALWSRLRAAAKRVGVGSVFPDATGHTIIDDHYWFIDQDIPSIDVIDFTFPCWHKTCDALPKVSRRSLDAVGETVYALLKSL